MDALVNSGLPLWKIYLLVGMTLTVIAASHFHSAREAWTGMQARELVSRWRQVLSYLGRHEVAYAKRVPMMILFVITSTAVIYTL